MNRAFVLATLAFTLLPSGAAAGEAAQERPTLRVTAGAMLVVRGTHFLPGERVKVSVAGDRRLTRGATALGSGSFAVRFRSSFDRCNSRLTVLAVGDRGSRARVKLPELMCPPRL